MLSFVRTNSVRKKKNHAKTVEEIGVASPEENISRNINISWPEFAGCNYGALSKHRRSRVGIAGTKGFGRYGVVPLEPSDLPWNPSELPWKPSDQSSASDIYIQLAKEESAHTYNTIDAKINYAWRCTLTKATWLNNVEKESKDSHDKTYKRYEIELKAKLKTLNQQKPKDELAGKRQDETVKVVRQAYNKYFTKKPESVLDLNEKMTELKR
jgi:hypothetical protein